MASKRNSTKSTISPFKRAESKSGERFKMVKKKLAALTAGAITAVLGVDLDTADADTYKYTWDVYDSYTQDDGYYYTVDEGYARTWQVDEGGYETRTVSGGYYRDVYGQVSTGECSSWYPSYLADPMGNGQWVLIEGGCAVYVTETVVVGQEWVNESRTEQYWVPNIVTYSEWIPDVRTYWQSDWNTYWYDTHSDVESYNINAYSGNRYKNRRATLMNSSPVFSIPAQTIKANETKTVAIGATDADNNEMFYSVSSSDESVTQATVDTEGTITLTAGKAAGTATITVNVRDSYGETTTSTFTTTVTNSAPVISEIADTPMYANASVTVPFTVSDAENSVVTNSVSQTGTGFTAQLVGDTVVINSDHADAAVQ